MFTPKDLERTVGHVAAMKKLLGEFSEDGPMESNPTESNPTESNQSVSATNENTAPNKAS